MDEEIERLLVSVRADTAAFARDVSVMRAELEGPLAAGADRAGRALEGALLRAVRTGTLGLEDLKKAALGAMAEIAGQAVRAGIGAAGGNGQGLAGLASQLLAGVLGLPGRATGGPVAPGRAYLVGERGPELFVPTSSGNIAPGVAQGARDIRLSITINGRGGDGDAVALAQSSRQVARAVKRALMQLDE